MEDQRPDSPLAAAGHEGVSAGGQGKRSYFTATMATMVMVMVVMVMVVKVMVMFPSLGEVRVRAGRGPECGGASDGLGHGGGGRHPPHLRRQQRGARGY